MVKEIWAALVMVLVTFSAMDRAISQEKDLAFIDDFKSTSSRDWHTAEYDFSNPHFDTDWRKSQVLFAEDDEAANEGVMLVLNPREPGDEDGNRFFGGSIRRQKKTGFGRYEAWFKAGEGDGVVTGFFTYTGPAYGTQHDEIDVEILGHKPEHLHVAWFVDGQLTNQFIELGFDATKDVHHYRFDWRQNQIDWFVDGKLKFRQTGENGSLPKNKGFLFANIWAADPSISAWAGEIETGRTTSAFFQGVKFTPFEAPFLTE